MEFEFIDNEDTVLSVPKSNERIWLSHPMFKTGELLKHINSKAIGIDFHHWEDENAYKERKRWYEEGVDCEMLQPNSNWKKGKLKIRISLEFRPDRPESPLDDIRQQIKALEN
ncbi:KGK domain-containing protein [Aliterella atlantica]|uniref:KGK domain-containing protein n=1 Tax=Aliterella atlantica CENA595 TaxID=1618023 RepID=A0A0D8ZYF1_9CYAN|nr:KGK domain-containing protein [Aliterella atlantica]KJH73489.1 hypothetical protein UH38_01590 [Aliterella atlantica CENA595]